MSKKSIPERSIYTQQLYDRSRMMEPGEIVSYKELSSIVGLDIQKEGYHYLTSARRIALKEDGMVIEAVWGEGIKRLTDEEISNSYGISSIKKVKRLTNKSIEKVVTVSSYDGLSEEARNNHLFSLTILGFLQHVSRPKTVGKVKEVIHRRQELINFKETLELFR